MQNELLLLRSTISFPLYLLASTPTRSCIAEWHFLCIFLQCTYQVLHGRILYERLLAICIRQQILRASPQALNTWSCTGNDEWGRAAVKSIASTARLHFAEPNQHVFTFLHPILFGGSHIEHHSSFAVRASPPVLSMWLQTAKFIVKNPKCAALAQEIDFSAPNSCSLHGCEMAQHIYAPPKKNVINWTWLHLNSFWLVIHNNWSRWFAISSSHVYAIPVTILLVGLPKKTS
jgi:hypothetical protein